VKKPFSAWKVGAPYYLPLLALGFGTIAYAGAQSYFYLYPSMIALLPGLFVLNFFRDPERTITTNPAEIVSPADGMIVEVADLEDSPHYDGPCKRISIFLNVFNVHVNRAPDECTIARIDYKEGAYKNAMSPEAGQLNEANTIRLDTPHGSMTVRQIAGLIARRIVCIPSSGDTLQKGEKFGMIKFGSRTELYLSTDAEILVVPKQKVEGGSTVLARFP